MCLIELALCVSRFLSVSVWLWWQMGRLQSALNGLYNALEEAEVDRFRDNVCENIRQVRKKFLIVCGGVALKAFDNVRPLPSMFRSGIITMPTIAIGPTIPITMRLGGPPAPVAPPARLPAPVASPPAPLPTPPAPRMLPTCGLRNTGSPQAAHCSPLPALLSSIHVATTQSSYS